MNHTQISITDYLNQPFVCHCGKAHTATIEAVALGQGKLSTLAQYMRDFGYSRPLVVFDNNTYKVAGKSVLGILAHAGICAAQYLFEDDAFVPNEFAVGRLVMAVAANCDVILAVGSGSLSDVCRFVSHKLTLPYFSIATAPSMDGYASTVAAMMNNHLKTSYITHAPQVIIADTDILKDAPMEMIAAGLGDILGKYTCLCDWKLSSIITNEYYCDEIVDMVRICVERVAQRAHEVTSRNPEVIGDITQALILSGIAMSFVNHSRPASGSEHHLSHYWEMKFLQQGKPAVLHGTKVGIATVIVLKIYKYALQAVIEPDFEAGKRFARQFDTNKWKADIRRLFGDAAEEILQIEEKSKKNDEKTHALRIAAIEENRAEIKDVIIKTLPDAQSIEQLLQTLQAPHNPLQKDIDAQTVTDAILFAKEIRDRYTVLQLIWDLGIAEQVARQVTQEIVTEYALPKASPNVPKKVRQE